VFPNDDEQQKRIRNFRNIALVIVVVIFAVILLQSFLGNSDSAEKQIRYSEFLALVEAGQVTTVNIKAGASSSALQGRVRPPSALGDNPQLAVLDAQRQQEQQRSNRIQSLLSLGERRLAWLRALEAEAQTLPYQQILQRQLVGLSIRASDLERSLNAIIQARKQKADEISALTQQVLGTADRFRTEAVISDSLLEKLEQHKVVYGFESSGDSSWIFSVLLSLLPFFIILLLWYGMMRRMQGEGSSALNFGRSQAKLVTKEYSRVTFDDVAGIDEVKEEV